jgi:hypothetical protein
MWLLAMIALVALLALVACALGQFWGPVLVGLGFAGWGAWLLLSGCYRSPWSEAGLLFLCGSVVEFAAAGEFWRWRGTEGGSPLGWRVMATLLAVAGSILAVGLVGRGLPIGLL